MKPEYKEFLKKNRIYFIDILIFLVVAGGFALSLSFVNSGVSQYLNTQQQISSTLFTYQENQASIDQYNKSNIANSSLQKVLPDQKSVINWVEQLEIIAGDCNVEETLSFGDANLTKDGIVVNRVPGASTSSSTITANLVLKGSYSNIIRFIDMMNHSYFFTQIDSMTISGNKSSQSTTPTPTSTVGPSAAPQPPVSANIALELYVNNLTAE